ncbi:hypothetical protein RFI_08699 [Reticulomyxa filosa]|uniref:Serine-threonine/tyrosine-protein kinase catalytic domain-containing protein n=1 Tax=Reticulomyxa filosa TaxID=46433 RepID=X6NRA2_RETFI|nr:hypothetical protein RFI_08699 [Reticulomyxa filosa]|eukprot:ETO28433.1 hypothetical protein RFI_08699 [Reticulomyxa filosa]
MDDKSKKATNIQNNIPLKQVQKKKRKRYTNDMTKGVGTLAFTAPEILKQIPIRVFMDDSKAAYNNAAFLKEDDQSDLLGMSSSFFFFALFFTLFLFCFCLENKQAQRLVNKEHKDSGHFSIYSSEVAEDTRDETLALSIEYKVEETLNESKTTINGKRRDNDNRYALTYRKSKPKKSTYTYLGCESDVYSFAIVAWEVMNVKRIYQDLDISHIREMILRGDRNEMLSMPQIPGLRLNSKKHKRQYRHITRLINECWDQKPSQRPTFEDIVERLKKIIDNRSLVLS